MGPIREGGGSIVKNRESGGEWRDFSSPEKIFGFGRTAGSMGEADNGGWVWGKELDEGEPCTICRG